MWKTDICIKLYFNNSSCDVNLGMEVAAYKKSPKINFLGWLTSAWPTTFIALEFSHQAARLHIPTTYVKQNHEDL